MSSNKYTDCLRLKNSERQELLDVLRETVMSPGTSTKRKHDRLDYRGQDIGLSLVGPSPSETHHYLTISRNLSATGISLLHGGFVYAGSTCTVTLTTLLGEREDITGTVVHCRLVRGRVHELGIHFDRVIDTHCFVGNDQSVATEADSPVLTTASGTVLFLDDQEAELLLFQHHVASSPITVLTATTSSEAIETLSAAAIDLLLCDLQLGIEDVSGEEVMRMARDAGYTGPIIALTGETSAECLVKAKAGGAVSVLLKPYNLTKLMNCLNEHMGTAANTEHNGDILSTLPARGPNVGTLLETYLNDVRKRCDALLASPREEGRESIRELCKMLQETGAGFGYAPLSEAARQIQMSLDASASVAESQEEILHLREVVDRLKPALHKAV